MEQDIESIEFSDPVADMNAYEDYEAPVSRSPETDLTISLRTLFSLFD